MLGAYIALAAALTATWNRVDDEKEGSTT